MVENEILMEQLHSMAVDQPVKDRARYVSAALEALDTNGSEAALLYQLFKELDKANDVEFGKVPDSKGDITRYAYYDHMAKCIESLSSFSGADAIPNITRMNKLHNILLNYRADFEFGYKRDIVLITTFYDTIVVELYAMIDMCIADYTNYLKLNFNERNNGKFNRKESAVISQVDSIIKIFESGQWTAIMKLAKAESVKVTSDPSYESYAATEAVKLGQLIKSVGNKLGNATDTVLDKVDNSLKTAASVVTPQSNLVAKGFAQVMTWFKNANMAGKTLIILGSVVAILMVIRGALYLFGRVQAMMSGYARNQATYLKAAMAADRDSSSSAVAKQQFMVDALQNTADIIDFKFKKAETQAAKDITASNKQVFSTATVSAGLNGVDFGF